MFLNKRYLPMLIFLLLQLPAVVLIESQAFEKKITARAVHLSGFTAQGLHRVININLKADDIPTNDSETTQVIAVVSMPFDFDGELDYKWSLTENIQHINGKLTGKIQQLKAQKKYSLNISVKGFSSLENRHVIFQVSGIKNGKRIIADAIIASKKEDTFEDIVQNVEKLKMEKNQ